MERGNLSPRQGGRPVARLWPAVGRAREIPKQRICEGQSTDAGHRGGPSRSSDEGPVMGPERRGRVVRAGSAVNRVWRGRSRVSEPKPKSFEISKRAVWEAYRRVKANKGAAGVDEQSIAEFERDLAGEPVQALESAVVGELLPAAGARGGDTEARRQLEECSGCRPSRTGSPRPSCADTWSPGWSRSSTPDSYGYRPGRSALDAVGVCRERCWRAGLGARPGHPVVLRQRPVTTSCSRR